MVTRLKFAVSSTLLALLLIAVGTRGLEHSHDCLRFLALGDWGTPLVAVTALAMAAKVNSTYSGRCHRRPDSILMIGDNFYESGLSSVNDPLFNEYFTRYFAHNKAFDGISFSVIAGNHDHRGSVQSQLDLHSAQSWYFPSPYYSRVFSAGNVNVLMVFLDTWDLIGGEADVNGESQRIVDTKQMEWLSRTLAEGTYTYKIVVGHYPIRSQSRDTPGLVRDLLPVLSANRVDAYIFGHDHVSQSLERDGLHYIGSGVGGGAGINGVRNNRHGLRWSHRHDLGFIDLSIQEKDITVDFYQVAEDHSSQVVYSTIIPRRKPGDVTLEMMLRSRLNADW